jgi:hypothetical protein
VALNAYNDNESGPAMNRRVELVSRCRERSIRHTDVGPKLGLEKGASSYDIVR